MTDLRFAGTCYEAVLTRAFGYPSIEEESQGNRHMVFIVVQNLENPRGSTGGYIAKEERDEVRRRLAEALQKLLDMGHESLNVPATRTCLERVKEASTTIHLAELAVESAELTHCYKEAPPAAARL
jgi:hypothetical protein